MSSYDRIGLGYDATRRADPYIAERLAHHLAPDGSAGAPRRYLDLACGTGNYTTALSMRGDEWHGVDRSSHMIANARPKTRAVHWCQARAERLPFSDSVFSGAMCTLALHHFDELGPIFKEVYRVLDRGKLNQYQGEIRISGKPIGGAGPSSKYRWKSLTVAPKPIFIAPQM